MSLRGYIRVYAESHRDMDFDIHSLDTYINSLTNVELVSYIEDYLTTTESHNEFNTIDLSS